MIITIQNFISHEEVAFWRHYVKFATINPSSEVTLKKVAVYTDGTEEEILEKVDRRYYSINSHFPLFSEVKRVAEENWKQKLKYSSSYGQIMHYFGKSKGLEEHAEPNISTVSCSINLSMDHEYTGAKFEIKDADVKLPYRAAVFYDSSLLHSVSPLVSGEKLSMVVWLPGKDQKVRDYSWRAT